METDELAAQLAAFEYNDCYRVDALLKETPQEITQRVYFVGSDGSRLGPFVRKTISLEAGLGAGYEAVFYAQREGVRFAYLPYILDCHREDARLIVVMENVVGVSLDEYIDGLNGGEERFNFVRCTFGQICDAVSELHERLDAPVIHRDLKPSNVMVGKGDSITLIDLGISRVFRDGAEQDTSHFGTRAYAPPEQFGFGQTSVRSDVYSLGMLLFFCLAGREATTADREGGFEALDGVHGLGDVVARATRFDPKDRYASAGELKQAFFEAVPARVTKVTHDSSQVVGGTRLLRMLERVPDSVGIVWNTFVATAAGLFTVASIIAYGQQGGSDGVAYPQWYKAISFFVCVPGIILSLAWMIADRRRVRRRFPILGRWTVAQETWHCLFALGGFFALFVLATAVSLLLSN